MISNSVQKLMQRPPACLDEVIVEALHHSFHYKLFWQWLRQRSFKTVSEHDVATGLCEILHVSFLEDCLNM